MEMTKKSSKLVRVYDIQVDSVVRLHHYENDIEFIDLDLYTYYFNKEIANYFCMKAANNEYDYNLLLKIFVLYNIRIP